AIHRNTAPERSPQLLEILSEFFARIPGPRFFNEAHAIDERLELVDRQRGLRIGSEHSPIEGDVRLDHARAERSSRDAGIDRSRMIGESGRAREPITQ